MATSVESRFWPKVNKNGPVPKHRPELGPCWIFTGALIREKGGYGYMGIGYKKGNIYAHRLSYQIHKGQIPKGLEIDHLCRVTYCVNPDHLEAVTGLENKRRGEKAQRTHCIHGHPFDAVNTYRKPNGCRRCRICSKEIDKKCRDRKAGK